MGIYLDSLRKFAAGTTPTVKTPKATPIPKANFKAPAATKVQTTSVPVTKAPSITNVAPPKVTMPQATEGLDLNMPNANELISEIMSGGTHTASLKNQEIQKEAVLPLILGAGALATPFIMRWMDRQGWTRRGRDMWDRAIAPTEFSRGTYRDAAGNLQKVPLQYGVNYDAPTSFGGAVKQKLDRMWLQPQKQIDRSINGVTSQMLREGWDRSTPENAAAFDKELYRRQPGHVQRVMGQRGEILERTRAGVRGGVTPLSITPRYNSRVQQSVYNTAAKDLNRMKVNPELIDAAARSSAGLSKLEPAVLPKGGMGGKPWMWLLGGLLGSQLLNGGGLFGGGQRQGASMPVMTPPMMYPGY